MAGVFERNIEMLLWHRLMGFAITNRHNILESKWYPEEKCEFKGLILSSQDLEECISTFMALIFSDEEFFTKLDSVHEQTLNLFRWTLYIPPPVSMHVWLAVPGMMELPENGIIERIKDDVAYDQKCHVAYQIALAQSKAILYEIIIKSLLCNKAILSLEKNLITKKCLTTAPVLYIDYIGFDLTLRNFYDISFSGGSTVKKNISVLTNTADVVKQFKDDLPNEVERNILSFGRRHLYYKILCEEYIEAAKHEKLLSDDEIVNILKLF